MILYTTFNQILAAMEDATTYLKWIEDKLTGNRNTYGLDTPIYILDVLNTMGIHDALLLMDCCIQDVTAIRKIIGIDLARNFQGAWQAYTSAGDMGKLDNLLVFAERCMDAQSADTTRYDYCGDPIPGSGDVTSAQVDTLITQITAIYDEWVYSIPVQPIYSWTPVGATTRTNDSIPAYQQDEWAYETEAYVDWMNPGSSLKSSDVASMGNKDIAQSMANDPDTFYNISLQLQQKILDTTNYLYQRVKIWPRGSDTMVINHEAQAAQYAAKAAIAAARLASRGIGSLTTIMLYCQRAQASTNSANYRAITRAMLRTRELGSMIMPYPAFPADDPAYDIEVDIINQAQNLRASLFRDQAFITQYDADYNGDLNATEFIALENGVRTAMKAKAKELSDAYYAAQTSGGTDLVATIDGILRGYLV